MEMAGGLFHAVSRDQKATARVKRRSAVLFAPRLSWGLAR
jgi:hypothetical protein